MLNCSIVYAAEKSDITTGARGILVDSKTKKPLKNIQLELFRVDKIENQKVFFSGKPKIATTDKDGVFIFKNLKVGKYSIGLQSGVVMAPSGCYDTYKNKEELNKHILEIVPSKIIDLGTISF
jgi:hypothetical protein